MSRVAKLASDMLIRIPDGGNNFINYIIYSIGVLVLVVISLFILIHLIKTPRRQELEKSEEMFHALMSAIASAIFVLENEKFLYNNPSAEELTGYTLEDFN